MSRPLRIAMFVGSFPVVSETFITRQIAGLLDLGHEVDIYAECPGAPDEPPQPEVISHRLLERTSFLDLPPECVPWEIPVWPLAGRTWVPGAATSMSNLARAARALPHFLRCFTAQPRLTLAAVRRSAYGFQAESLSILYRLSSLLDKP